jgi:hypothetical protein
MDKKKYINFLFRRVDPDHLKKLFERELSDQEPCYYRKKPNESGFEMFHSTVVDSVSDFVFYDYTKFDEATDYDSEIEIIKTAINMLFKYDISKYYHDVDCSDYGKQNMFESKDSKPNKKSITRLRRLQELRDIIDYQTEIQDPCNFEDGEEYADFCINEGLSFFYGDEGYRDEEEYEKDYDIFDNHEEREEVEKLMYEEYYDMLSKYWEESSC